MVHPRYIPNDSSQLLKEENPRQQLIICLTNIVRKYPPKKKWDRHELRGLYSGPTSIAYLFFRLSHMYPYLLIEDRDLRSWCSAYLMGEREFKADRGADECGIINEELVLMVVMDATTSGTPETCWFEDYAAKFASEPGGSNEWLYGRAGLLYLLRLVRAWGSEYCKEAADESIKIVGDRILEDGPPWEWHGKEYLGAVHGTIGIIMQLVLSRPAYTKDPRVVNCLREVLASQDEHGNFPSSVGSSKNHLVQFCHGAPGVVLSLSRIRDFFDPDIQEAIDRAVVKARACIWKKGLLTKEPSLCHGVTGNALALEFPQAEHFMAHTTAEMLEKGKREGWYLEGSNPYGLFCGEAGRAWGWAAMDPSHKLHPLDILGYSDI
ncbi:MAG: hypothetical protein Q9174_001872 [Haloplaca sp. 1 TL-2023]